MRACRNPAFDVGDFSCALEGTPESPPFDRQGKARFAGVQPCTPASHPASIINKDGGRTTAFGDEPE
jgi:hypothetical protein